MTRRRLKSALTCRILCELVSLLTLAAGLIAFGIHSVPAQWAALGAVAAGGYGAHASHEAARRIVGQLRRAPA